MEDNCFGNSDVLLTAWVASRTLATTIIGRKHIGEHSIFQGPERSHH